MQYFAAIILFVSAAAGAQSIQPDAVNPAGVEKSKISKSDTRYCVYDDKKYTEGAVKSVDGQMLICMVRSGLSVSLEGGVREPRELVWELGSSLRGKTVLKTPASVFK